MANRKITELNALTGANATDTDVFAIVDVSADETKKMSLGELKEAFDSGSGFVRITGDTMTGDLTVPNVVVSGNVDGRDVSADGTKLDGIEAGADVTDTANVSAAGAAMETGAAFTGNVTFGDNDKAIFGAGSDLQIYHAGADSFINESNAAGWLYLQASNLAIRSQDFEYFIDCNANSSVDLYYDNSKKLATTATGIDVTGTVTMDGGSTSADFTFGDNDKAIFGAGSDLQIFHTGAYSAIRDVGTGGLFIGGENYVDIGNAGASESYARFYKDAQVDLYHNGAVKFATTTSGVDVTGEVKADKFTNDEALPTVRPSLLLDFANSKTLDPRITFSRGSTATYWDGKTTTKAEENLITYSNLSSDVSVSNCSITSTSETAPDGSAQGREITSSDTSTVRVQMSTNVTNGKFYAFSVYLKYVDWQYISLDVQDSRFNGNANLVVDLVNGTITKQNGYSNGTITDVGNGWYRVGFVDLCSFTSTNAFMVYQNDGGTTLDVNGVTSGKKWLMWGMQVEQRDAITAYTATSGSPIVKYQPTLQTASSGEARFDHDPVTGESKGLLIEESRTNLLSHSENFPDSNWSKAKCTVQGNQKVSPLGTLTADKLVADTQYSGDHRVTQTTSVSSGTYYTSSVYAKAGEYTGITMHNFGAVVPSAGITVGLTNGNVSVRGNLTSNLYDYGVEDVGNGWYRLWCTVITTSTGALTTAITVQQTDVGAGTPAFAGNDFDGVYIWGAQLEQGAFPTSYIPTSGSTVTRSVDICEVGQVSSWYSADRGTMYAEYTQFGNGYSGTSGIWEIYSESSGTKGWDLRNTSTESILYAQAGNGNQQVIVTGAAYGGYNVEHRAIVSWSTSGIRVATEYDATSATSTANSTFAAYEMEIGRHDRNSSRVLNGWFKKVSYTPAEYSESTVRAMTEE